MEYVAFGYDFFPLSLFHKYGKFFMGSCRAASSYSVILALDIRVLFWKTWGPPLGGIFTYILWWMLSCLLCKMQTDILFSTFFHPYLGLFQINCSWCPLPLWLYISYNAELKPITGGSCVSKMINFINLCNCLISIHTSGIHHHFVLYGMMEFLRRRYDLHHF